MLNFPASLAARTLVHALGLANQRQPPMTWRWAQDMSRSRLAGGEPALLIEFPGAVVATMLTEESCVQANEIGGAVATVSAKISPAVWFDGLFLATSYMTSFLHLFRGFVSFMITFQQMLPMSKSARVSFSCLQLKTLKRQLYLLSLGNATDVYLDCSWHLLKIHMLKLRTRWRIASCKILY